MIMKILVAYNGSLSSKLALRYGIEKAQQHNGRLIVLHVFNRNQFIDYEGGYRAEMTARHESSRYLEEARRILRDEAGSIRSQLISAEGPPEEVIVGHAQDEDVDIVFSPFRYNAISEDIACPVCLIPQNIFLPSGAF
jgi:nucleotide-binding universal stress UspA family protein